MDPLVIIGRISIWGCSSSVLFCTFLFPYFQGCISPFYCVLFLCNSIATLSSFTNTRLFSQCLWARRPDMVSWLLCSGPHSLYCRHLLWPWSRLRLPRGGNRLKLLCSLATLGSWWLLDCGAPFLLRVPPSLSPLESSHLAAGVFKARGSHF